jgi:glyoxylase-like metal-dependent hydrolase (beta-lactamase superfamily II)
MRLAMEQVNLRLEQVTLIVCTHAHSDHWGQVAPIRDIAGCEFWMHPNHAHGTASLSDPEAALARRLEVGRQSGTPPQVLERYAERAKAVPSGVARMIEPDRPLVRGVVVETDLGPWEVYETPGHAPSHVCLHQRERRLMISGDHLLGRISLYYDYGWTPDPVGEFLASLSLVQELDVRLCLSGHGKPFVDFQGHIDGNRALVRERLDAVLSGLRDGPRKVIELASAVHGGEALRTQNAAWWVTETLCYVRHLETVGAVSLAGEDRWALQP